MNLEWLCFPMNGLHTAYLNMLWSSSSIGDAYMGVMYSNAYVENGHPKHTSFNEMTQILSPFNGLKCVQSWKSTIAPHILIANAIGRTYHLCDHLMRKKTFTLRYVCLKWTFPTIQHMQGLENPKNSHEYMNTWIDPNRNMRSVSSISRVISECIWIQEVAL